MQQVSRAGWRPFVAAALAWVLLITAPGVPLAATGTVPTRAFLVEIGDATYRLELSGLPGMAGGPFQARIFRLLDSDGRASDADAADAAERPITVRPLPAGRSHTDGRVAPDAALSVESLGSLTAVTIEVGEDRIEAELPAGSAAKSAVCGPDDVIVGPRWVEVNGVPVEVPDVVADLQHDPLVGLMASLEGRGDGGGRNDARDDPSPLHDPRSFFGNVATLHAAVVAAIGPKEVDFGSFEKRPCAPQCVSCASGLMRVGAMTGLMTLTCASVGPSGGTSIGGCMLAIMVATTMVAEAGARCAVCNQCIHGSGGNDPCHCTCHGEPLCDCSQQCPPSGGPPDDIPRI